MSKPTLNEILGRFNLTIDMLDVEILAKFYDDIACCISDWRSVARACEMNIDDYDEDWRREKNKRVAFLTELKRRYSMNATYQLLVKKLYQGDLVHDARNICEVFKNKVLLDHSTEKALRSIGVEVVKSTKSSSSQHALTPAIGDQLLMPRHLQHIKWKDSAGCTHELRLYRQLGPEWKQVADLIGLEPAVVKTIDKNNREIEDCIREVTNRWIQDAPNLKRYKCTWNGMCRLLNDISQATDRQSLEQALNATMSTLLGNFSADDLPLPPQPAVPAHVDPAPPSTSHSSAGKKKMNPTELHAWLLEQSVDEEDAQTLRDKGVNEAVFMKISEKTPKFYDILKEGTQLLLEDLQEQLRKRN